LYYTVLFVSDILSSTMRSSTFFSSLALFAQSSIAANVFISSYSGLVTTVNVAKNADGNYSLTAIAETTGCTESPSWLTYDPSKSVLFCSDEGLTVPNGTLSSFKAAANGSLVQLDKIMTISGGVKSEIYGNGTALAVAFYAGSSLSSFDIHDPTDLNRIQSRTFELTAPGADPARQDAPHPHQTILDPTGNFIIVPDLGADLVRVFHIEKLSNNLTPVTPLQAVAGTGPRHARFLATQNATYMYVVTEIGNTLTGYKVTYNKNNTLGFDVIYEAGSFGLDVPVPVGAATAEVHISPDKNFLIVSSRNDSSYTLPNFDPTNSTSIISDTILNYKIDHSTGALTLLQTVPAGGSYPRDFSINNAGDLVLVGLQYSASAVLIERDVETGMLGGFVGEVGIAGQVTCAIFMEGALSA